MPFFRGTAQEQPVEAQRLGKVVRHHVGQRPTGHPADDLADQPAVSDGVVAGLRAGLVGRSLPGQGVDHVVPIQNVVGILDDAAKSMQAGGVAEHVTDGQVLLSVLRELGPVGGHRRVVVHPTGVGLQVQGRRGDPLGGAEAHRHGVGLPRVAVVGAQPAPQVHHQFAPVIDGQRGPARGTPELIPECLGDVDEAGVGVSLHPGNSATIRRIVVG